MPSLKEMSIAMGKDIKNGYNPFVQITKCKKLLKKYGDCNECTKAGKNSCKNDASRSRKLIVK
jgi:hypothetical protein